MGGRGPPQGLEVRWGCSFEKQGHQFSVIGQGCEDPGRKEENMVPFVRTWREFKKMAGLVLESEAPCAMGKEGLGESNADGMCQQKVVKINPRWRMILRGVPPINDEMMPGYIHLMMTH